MNPKETKPEWEERFDKDFPYIERYKFMHFKDNNRESCSGELKSFIHSLILEERKNVIQEYVQEIKRKIYDPEFENSFDSIVNEIESEHKFKELGIGEEK